jgi:hypothetical protein
MTTNLVFPVVRQHLAVLFAVVPTRKVEMVKVQIDTELAGGGIHHAQAFRHDFLANAIAGNHSYAVSGHGISFVSKKQGITLKKHELIENQNAWRSPA